MACMWVNGQVWGKCTKYSMYETEGGPVEGIGLRIRDGAHTIPLCPSSLLLQVFLLDWFCNFFFLTGVDNQSDDVGGMWRRGKLACASLRGRGGCNLSHTKLAGFPPLFLVGTSVSGYGFSGFVSSFFSTPFWTYSFSSPLHHLCSKGGEIHMLQWRVCFHISQPCLSLRL
jgi:hypothetical protein